MPAAERRDDARSTRVFFHVGAPKTGTTYLQHRLFDNRAALASDGVLYPYERFGDSFRSVLDFSGTGWGGSGPHRFRGAWAAVARRIRAWSGPTVIVSNELFGAATPTRIRAGLRSVGDAEVHVVFTARDIARQLVSDWQEHIKHKHVVTLESFVDDLVTLGLDAPRPFGEMFWGLHDPARILGRWGEFIPPERIHVITVPPPGAPADTLWRRFAQVVGLDPTRYADHGSRRNSSMGVNETELVRRMNRRLRRMSSEAYDPLVRRMLAERVLGNRSSRLMLPPAHLEWASAWSAQLVDELTGRGYHVVGKLDELMPRPEDHAAFVSPSELSDGDLAPAAIRAATKALLLAARQRRTITELRRQVTGDDAEPVGGGGSAGSAIGRARARARDVLDRVRSHG